MRQVGHRDTNRVWRRVHHRCGTQQQALSHRYQQLIKPRGGVAVVKGVVDAGILQIPELKFADGGLRGAGIQEKLLPVKLPDGDHGAVGQTAAAGQNDMRGGTEYWVLGEAFTGKIIQNRGKIKIQKAGRQAVHNAVATVVQQFNANVGVIQIQPPPVPTP